MRNVTMALCEEFDVAILASTDTDLRPPLEAFAVLPFNKETVIEVASWQSPVFKKALRVPDQQVWCHFIEEAEYRTVRDNRDYNRKRSN